MSNKESFYLRNVIHVLSPLKAEKRTGKTDHYTFLSKLFQFRYFSDKVALRLSRLHSFDQAPYSPASHTVWLRYLGCLVWMRCLPSDCQHTHTVWCRPMEGSSSSSHHTLHLWEGWLKTMEELTDQACYHNYLRQKYINFSWFKRRLSKKYFVLFNIDFVAPSSASPPKNLALFALQLSSCETLLWVRFKTEHTSNY